jgi:hypothetical protein
MVNPPWNPNERYYVYNQYDRNIGDPQRVISETDLKTQVCPHCPSGLLCLTRNYAVKDLSIREEIPAGKLVVVCCVYQEPWRGEPLRTEFYIPLDYYKGAL